MIRLQQLLKFVAFGMTTVMLITSLPVGIARAALITTDQVIADGMPPADRDRVVAFLQREDVRAQMVALGVDPAEAMARVASLSDREVQAIA
ncbi:MAG: PA2779 family protein, partial [Geminicoccaceae bacterium]